MKKLISTILVIIFLFNFTSCNIMRAYASGSLGGGDGSPMSEAMTADDAAPSNTASSDILEEGQVSRVTGGAEKSKTTVESAGITILGTVLGIIALLVDILVFQVDLILGQLTATTVTDSAGDQEVEFFFSLERTVFNRVSMFDVRYFDYISPGNETYTVGTEGNANEKKIEKSSSIDSIKLQVAKVYQFVRVLALVIGLLVLIYIGIRMALAASASDKADYKKMLISWVESVVLLFIMPYVMSFIMTLSSALTNIFFNIEQTLLNNGSAEVFEDTIRDQLLTSLFEFAGMELTIWSIMYWVLLFAQVRFFLLYLKRVLMVGFLIIISPLITITYAIDKVGDGKAQSFFVWFKEFTVNILIQPLHAVIYLVFILTANEVSKKAPLLALAFLLSLGTVEKMVKRIFNLKGLVTLKDSNQLLKKGK